MVKKSSLIAILSYASHYMVTESMIYDGIENGVEGQVSSHQQGKGSYDEC
jgi:hypothetical protein